MKTCSKCRCEKELTDFPKHKNRRDGHGSYCKECFSIYSKSRREDPSSGYKTREEEYRAKRRTHLRDYHKSWRDENSDKFSEICKKARIKYRNTTHGRSMTNYWNSKRRAAKLSATPTWLKQADLDEIYKIYLLCSCYNIVSEEEYHVDHIVPLQGANVCGLHVPNNLQIIKAVDNIKKSNSFEE